MTQYLVDYGRVALNSEEVRDWAKRQVGPGWQPILHTFFRHCERWYEEVTIRQVKEKFGVLSMYVLESGDGGPVCKLPKGPSITLYQVIALLELASSHTCEWCGKLGQLRTSRPWHLTLCPDCEEIHCNGGKP